MDPYLGDPHVMHVRAYQEEMLARAEHARRLRELPPDDEHPGLLFRLRAFVAYRRAVKFARWTTPPGLTKLAAAGSGRPAQRRAAVAPEVPGRPDTGVVHQITGGAPAEGAPPVT